MPLYEYACQQCGEQSEQLITGTAQPACPQCGSTHLNRLLSIVAAPNRGTSDAGHSPPSGSCGGGCACHPHR
jgi:putative FmdB family regulatory protein